MSWSFDTSPASFNNLARTEREKQNGDIRGMDFDTLTGDLVVYRGDGKFISYNQHINLYDGSDASWKYAVGSENVDTLLALKEFGEETKLEEVVVQFFNGANDKNMQIKDSMSFISPSEVTSPENSPSYKAMLQKITDQIEDHFVAGRQANSHSDQLLYGDRDTGHYIGATLVEDYLIGADGNDTMLGLLGSDKLSGANGDDFLYGGYGDDTINGDDGNDFLYGEQNNDHLFGSNGNDLLDGGLGADYLSGGRGNDTYMIDNKGDVVEDKGAASDIDTVLVPIYMSYTLPTNIEDGTLEGNSDSALTGNSDDNELEGNTGDNRLDGSKGDDEISGETGDDQINGGVGKDDLEGGLGNDQFIFNTSLTKANIDDIADFSIVDDTIALENSVFAGLGKGDLSSAAFHIGTGAQDGSDRIIYDEAHGKLWYDKDGTGSSTAVLFATIDAGLDMKASDFDII